MHAIGKSPRCSCQKRAGGAAATGAASTPAGNWQQEWNLKYGWTRPDDPPVVLDSSYTTIRKVEIHDVYDLKRWWWKVTDGNRETTWPGVYNRSRLIGRNDYFQLPDWDCYSLSGKTVTSYMPDEPWNHLEVAGGAWGTWTLLSHAMEKAADEEKTLNAPSLRDCGGFVASPFPTLKRGANNHCAYGAGVGAWG